MLGCSIGAVSDILRSARVAGRKTRPQVGKRVRLPYIKELRRRAYGALRRKALAALTLGAASAGCSLSYTARQPCSAPSSDVTGSITLATGAKPSRANCRPKPISPLPAAAVSEVLRRGRKDASQPWENPGTGARGTVTPHRRRLYARTAHLPRFPRELRRGSAQSWLQGEACKPRSRQAASAGRARLGKSARSSPGSGNPP